MKCNKRVGEVGEVVKCKVAIGDIRFSSYQVPANITFRHLTFHHLTYLSPTSISPPENQKTKADPILMHNHEFLHLGMVVVTEHHQVDALREMGKIDRCLIGNHRLAKEFLPELVDHGECDVFVEGRCLQK
jgi:hypothetical protein